MSSCVENIPVQVAPYAAAWNRQMDQWRLMRCKKNVDPASSVFWNSLNIWEDYERYTQYPGLLLEPVQAGLDSRRTVLDIGAGSGSLAIPLARRAKHVTAVEPSGAQCDRLTRAMQAAAIGNISIIPKDWDSVELDELGTPDLVVASYCLFMRDIAGAIAKMCQVARQRICLVHLGGHDLLDVVRKIRPEEAQVPDYQLLMEVLKEMGLDASVKLIPRTFALPLELQLNMFRAAQGFADAEILKVKEALNMSDRLELQAGELWLRRSCLDALIVIEVG